MSFLFLQTSVGAHPQLEVVIGQWAGPYELDLDSEWATFEIAHAAVLPPPELGEGDPREAQQRVLFGVLPGIRDDEPWVCFNTGSECTAPSNEYGRTYLWEPRDPANVTAVPSPYPTSASQDFFCGGHTFLPNGDLLWVGGTDPDGSCMDVDPDPMVTVCQLGFTGHDYAWRLNATAKRADLAWTNAGAMSLDRWYPTATLLADGRVMVTGHAQNPELPGADLYADFYSAATGWEATPAPNTPYFGSCVNVPEPLPLLDYPRLHLLSRNMLMQTNAAEHVGVIQNRASRFMDFNLNSMPCIGDPRFEEGDFMDTQRVNGGSVHLITFDALIGFTEVVYVVGGGTRELELESICASSLPPEHLATVERMINPEPSAVWLPAASMNRSRNQHNTVVLLDGSIMAVGGQGVDNLGLCKSRKTPERYKPEEVFGSPAPAAWGDLAFQGVDRRYHSVAGLLPDGRVFSAGGVNPSSSDLPDHTVEIYSPPYFFKGPRPAIDSNSLLDPHTSPYPHATAITIEVMVSSTSLGAQIDRVALLRNGSATHAFDMSQRYVELEILFDLPVDEADPLRRELTVLTPQDEAWAPKGFYMLTAVSANHQPSPAQWIRLE